jgi:Fur family ferric uptake transcriptional regulator
MSTTGTWLETLAAAGFRLTGPRRLLAELIAARPAGFSAADLLADPQAGERRLGRATVFRTLDLLHSLGVLERLELADGEHTYVPCEPVHHHHVVCSGCGRATEVEGCALSSFAAEVGVRSGYRIDRHQVEFFGLCPACQARRGSPRRRRAA